MSDCLSASGTIDRFNELKDKFYACFHSLLYSIADSDKQNKGRFNEIKDLLDEGMSDLADHLCDIDKKLFQISQELRLVNLFSINNKMNCNPAKYDSLRGMSFSNEDIRDFILFALKRPKGEISKEDMKKYCDLLGWKHE